MTKPYNKQDHSHCFESDSPPCAIKGRHRCCLCEEPMLRNSQDSLYSEKDVNKPHEKFAVYEKGVKRAISSLTVGSEMVAERIGRTRYGNSGWLQFLQGFQYARNKLQKTKVKLIRSLEREAQSIITNELEK